MTGRLSKQQHAAAESALLPGRLKMLRQRQEIIDTAIGLFAERGFEATSINDIVDKVKVSERTFFRYFRIKEELVFDWADRNGYRGVAFLREMPAGPPPLIRMKAMLESQGDKMEEDRSKSAAMLRIIHSSPALRARGHYEFAKWETAFIAALTNDEPLLQSEVVKLELEVALALAAFTVAIRQWSNAGGTGDVRPWIRRALDFL